MPRTRRAIIALCPCDPRRGSRLGVPAQAGETPAPFPAHYAARTWRRWTRRRR